LVLHRQHDLAATYHRTSRQVNATPDPSGIIAAVRAAVLAPLALLLAYGVAFAAAALGVSSPLAFDDHPGQLYRVWHVVRHGFAPWAWNAGWWAGYPELQFYPPGFSYAAALLHYLSLGLASVPAAYQTLLWVTYLAPGLTAFMLLARVTGNGWHALPGAFVALTFSAGVASGVEGGVRWGMVAARLGWAFVPLLVFTLVRWIEDERGALPPVAPLIAALVITHPAHLPTAIVIVLAAAFAGSANRWPRVRAALLLLGLAAALTAFWSLPLMARLGHARALAWGGLGDGLGSALARPLPLTLIALAVLAYRPGAVPFPRTAGVVARVPWLMALVIAADALVAEPLGIRWLPADRIADGGWMALVLAAGLGAAQLIHRQAVSRGVSASMGAFAMVILLVAFAWPGRTLTLWPVHGDWPTYDSLERGFRLPALWAALGSAPDGHVLITRSSVPLAYGTAWYRPHSHITALTPLQSGRSIIHGTFTHPSPIAAFLYRGSAGPGAITTLVERLDGDQLFGRRFANLDAPTFNEIADRLGISAVVVFDEDLSARDAMAANPEFAPRPPSPPFLLYVRRVPPPAPRERAPGRWHVALDGKPGDWTSARIAYYPLWRAEQEGRPLATREGRLGELEVRLAVADRPVDLTYRPSWPETTGLVISGLAVLVWLNRLGGWWHASREARVRERE
jgi:hypothetical protein